MADRVEQTRMLLRSLYDYLPSVRTWMSTLATTGPGPSRRAPCGPCAGRGIHKKGRCAACEGRGWIMVDDYTGEEVATKDTRPPRRIRWVMCDGCGGDRVHANGVTCPRCDGYGSVEATAPTLAGRVELAAVRTSTSGETFAWERMRLAQFRQGSYAEVVHGLDALRAWSESHYSLVMHVEVYGEDITLYAEAQQIVDATVSWIAGHMPHEIVVPHWAARKALERPVARGRWANEWARGQRNEEIRARHRKGWSMRRIARSMGISPSAVSRVLAADDDSDLSDAESPCSVA